MFTIKQNDTSPALSATLKDPNSASINLTGAAIQFAMKHDDGTPVVTGGAVITSANTGGVRYDWSTGDTAKAGSYSAEFQVTYIDGTIETFPNKGYIRLLITEEIA